MCMAPALSIIPTLILSWLFQVMEPLVSITAYDRFSIFSDSMEAPVTPQTSHEGSSGAPPVKQRRLDDLQQMLFEKEIVRVENETKKKKITDQVGKAGTWKTKNSVRKSVAPITDKQVFFSFFWRGWVCQDSEGAPEADRTSDGDFNGLFDKV